MKPSPIIPAAATGDAKIIELIFDNSTLPVGRAILRTETFADLEYEWLDFVELCMEIEDQYKVDMEELCDLVKFGRVTVEEIIKAVKKGQKLVVVAISIEVTPPTKEIV